MTTSPTRSVWRYLNDIAVAGANSGGPVGNMAILSLAHLLHVTDTQMRTAPPSPNLRC